MLNDSFPLPETGSGTDLDSDSKPNGYIACAKHVHIAQTQTRIPTPYFCTGQESESVSLSECVSSNERLGPFTPVIKSTITLAIAQKIANFSVA